MKYLLYLVISLSLYSCFSTQNTVRKNSEEKPVVISNDSIEYKIIVLDPGFNSYLLSIARPMEFYSESYYQNRNILYVNEWNARVRNPMSFKSEIFEQVIDYDAFTDYGLEVNYKLYNYFKFVEYKYKVNFNVGLR
ncbi:DUF6146 family protein [Flavicella sediminum]|uniref:DUF6146 family protein n=1 Tax=Flavicella sediminum TaxID=2585141 RepID=UPI001121DA7D|nr:DUF6146 family protein [Flavicella sediminum]